MALDVGSLTDTAVDNLVSLPSDYHLIFIIFYNAVLSNSFDFDTIYGYFTDRDKSFVLYKI